MKLGNTINIYSHIRPSSYISPYEFKVLVVNTTPHVVLYRDITNFTFDLLGLKL